MWQISKGFASVTLPTYVFFDGDCAACHGIVRWLLRKPCRQRFRFIPLQYLSDVLGEKALLDLGSGPHLGRSSIVVIKNGAFLVKSAAVLGLLSELGFFWRLASFKWRFLLPRRLLDFCYDRYAGIRIKLFGEANLGKFCDLLPRDQSALVLANPEPWLATKLAFFQPRLGVFLTAQWVNLLVVNYKVPAEVLRPFLPEGTELDDWQGDHLVSLVAFSFVNTAMGDVSLPLYKDFEEVNLRFYVKRRVPTKTGTDEVRGVVFIKELVPYRLITWIANLAYGENYHRASTRHFAHNQGPVTELGYRFSMPGSSDESGGCEITMTSQGLPEPIARGSLEEFITEHYYGYVADPGGGTREYEVEHPRWQIWKDPQLAVKGDVAAFYPAAFAPYLSTPHSVVASPGSCVRVFKGSSGIGARN